MEMQSRMGCRGHVVAELFGPDGKLRQKEEIHNLVTDVGDEYLAQLAMLGGAQWGTHAMKLGDASTAASKSGAGSFVGADYCPASAHACDESTPKEGASANIVQFIHTWIGADLTDVIRRVGIVNNTTNAAEADATNTLAMAVFSGDIAKGADDTLKVTWNITFLGA